MDPTGASAQSILDKLVLALLAIIVATSAGCGSEGKTANESPKSQHSRLENAVGPGHGGRLVIGVQEEPERLSEILNSTATTNLVCNLLFAKFVKYDDQLRLLPDLIEEIPTLENGGVSADFLTYEYRLRRDARWHDGAPVTSADVAFTYGVIMHPKVVVESREGWDVIDSLLTPDAHTVVFRLKKPYPDFVAETFLEESVLPSHILGGLPPGDFHLSDYHRAPVGSGPFRFREWVAGSHIVLTRNDLYHDEGPYLDEIIVKFVPDANTLLMQLKTGEIDVYDNADLGFIDQVNDLKDIAVYSTQTMMYEHLDLNTESPVLADKRVRQALSFATNRKELTEGVYRGWATVAALDEHPASKYFNAKAAAKVRYSPFRARQLLRQAGWIDTDGDGILEKDGKDLVLTITATSGRPNRERTEIVLKQQYRDVGIDLRIKNYNATVLYGSYEDGGILKRGEFDIAMYAWLSSPEPATKASLYSIENIPPAGQNHPRIRHRELSDLLAAGSREIDEEARIKLYYRVSDLLVEEVPVIPLFWYTTVDLCSTRLQNYKPNPSQSTDTWNAGLWRMAD